MVSLQVFYKNLEGKTKTLEISPFNTVMDLKELICNKENISIAQQRIIYGGVELENEKMIHHYKIENESTLNFVIRLKGGCKKCAILCGSCATQCDNCAKCCPCCEFECCKECAASCRNCARFCDNCIIL